jgi:hypothetical protein
MVVSTVEVREMLRRLTIMAIYLAGTTSSSDYIATPNTHQTNLYNSGNDASSNKI